MAGTQPKYRFYVADENGKIDYKNEAFAVWENVTRDGNKVYLAGKTKDGRKVQGWPVTDRLNDGSVATDGPGTNYPENPDTNDEAPF